jgi:hypothetical protein
MSAESPVLMRIFFSTQIVRAAGMFIFVAV